VLAFHGLGDALKALDAYQLDPTDANLKKLNETLGQMGPAAQVWSCASTARAGPEAPADDGAVEPVPRRELDGLDEMLTMLSRGQGRRRQLASRWASSPPTVAPALAHDADWQALLRLHPHRRGPDPRRLRSRDRERGRRPRVDPRRVPAAVG
jgi:hypothetical protein